MSPSQNCSARPSLRARSKITSMSERARPGGSATAWRYCTQMNSKNMCTVSPALTRRVLGTLKPSAFAVLRLIASSNLGRLLR
jgi:hypothetical protein